MRRYQCADFNAASEDAGILYPTNEGPTNVVLQSISYWAACEMCAENVDKENIDALVGYVMLAFNVQGYAASAKLIQNLRHVYTLFFKHRVRDED